jgi:penicillin G amidase
LDRDLAKSAIGILSDWNFVTDLESKGATIYYALTYHTMKNMLVDEMGEDQFKIYGTVADSIISYKYLIQNPDHPIWNDVTTEDKSENRVDILNQSLLGTVRFLRNNVSSSPNLWHWKNLYHVEYVHAIGRKKPFNYLFNLGPFPTWGAPEVVNNLKAKLNDGDYSVKSGPSTRRIVSFGDLDQNKSILPTGNSGNLASPYYDNQVNMYLNGIFRNVNFTEKTVKKSQKHELILINR